MNEGRPDPDQLLQRVVRKRAKTRRQLKIFFGAAPGVARPMHARGCPPEETRGRGDRGRPVETHGRKETEALSRDWKYCPAGRSSIAGRS